MDHFNITQKCSYCSKDKKIFRVDLELYDDSGTLKHGTKRMKKFHFTCRFCSKSTPLDFYRFSHPELICYLKRLHEHYKETSDAIDKLYVLFNKTI